MTKKRNKKTKHKKLTSIPIIQRRLFRLASILCRERAKFTCEICGLKSGDIHPKTGKPQRVEAHHVMSRSNKNSPLKYDLRNLVCLCTEHHKTGRLSAHKHCLWFSLQFQKIRPKDAKWIIDHTNDEVDLKDREVLTKIERCLKANLPLDFSEPKEKEIESKQLTFNF
jgi:hypothetical protein